MEKFLEALQKDKSLMEEFGKQTTKEGAYSVAKPYIGGMSKEEFYAQMGKVANLIQKKQSGELSDDDLQAASGGVSTAQKANEWLGFGLNVVNGLMSIFGGMKK